MTPSLRIIIVNWNSGEQLNQCLASIEIAKKNDFSLSNICIVDNASHDNSIKGIEKHNLPIQIIKNEQNMGFAAACNQGAKGSQDDYLLFFNPDAQMYENSIEVAIAFMEKPANENVGIIGIQLLNDSGVPDRSCARFPTWGHFFVGIFGLDKLSSKWFPIHFMREWDHSENRVVDHVMGSFYLVRRTLFERLRGFDERFFVYLEDVDFSYRAWKEGWHSLYLTDAQAYHRGGGTSKQIKDKRLFYTLRSRIFYSYKHFSWWSATSIAFMTLFVEPITRIIWAAMRLSGMEMVNTLKGYFMLWRDLPMFLKEAWESEA